MGRTGSSPTDERRPRRMPLRAASIPSGSHDVSILIDVGAGVGRYRGSQPRAKTSMIIMRAPQRGQMQGGTRGSSGVAACSSSASTTRGIARHRRSFSIRRAHAVVLSIDEKSEIQALDRIQPGLPIKPGRCQTMTQDYNSSEPP